MSFTNGGMQPNGGLRLPPFQTTHRDEPGPIDPPKHFLTAEEAASTQSMLFDQLDTFEGYVHHKNLISPADDTSLPVHLSPFSALLSSACVHATTIQRRGNISAPSSESSS